ncbi:MAG: WGR domain-containing protein [Shinella sp.]|nr:MAG: WGR domain-containing protein [Shinella sp.]
MNEAALFHLERRDASRNMKRFYRLSVERDLFGETLLIREWGRIGKQGRRREEPHANPDTAHRAAVALARSKRRRGYVEIAGGA